MKSILLPTDFSIESKAARKYILNFFNELEISYRVILLNAYSVIGCSDEDLVKMNDIEKNKSRKALEMEKNVILSEGCEKLFSVECISNMGTLTNIVPKIVKQKEIDLVIMGKDGGQHVEEVSRALKADKSNCPLLIVFAH